MENKGLIAVLVDAIHGPLPSLCCCQCELLRARKEYEPLSKQATLFSLLQILLCAEIGSIFVLRKYWKG
jgi:hypothetical protein